MQVKVTNTSSVEQRIRMGEDVEAIAPGKAKILDLDQPEIERLRARVSLELQEIPIEDAPKGKGKKS